MADLYALAIQTDRVRFGALTFLAAGERLLITGCYQYAGRKIYQFNDAKELNKSGSAGYSHEWWHRFNPKKKNEQLRADAHMKMRDVAYFLKLLDGQDAREPNGKTILEIAQFRPTGVTPRMVPRGTNPETSIAWSRACMPTLPALSSASILK